MRDIFVVLFILRDLNYEKMHLAIILKIINGTTGVNVNALLKINPDHILFTNVKINPILVQLFRH